MNSNNNKAKQNVNFQQDSEKEAIREALKQEYNTILSKQNSLKDHNEIIREYLKFFNY